MSRFSLHLLNDTEFEALVVLICRELMGIGVTSFAAGPDGGKDAKFDGTASAFPSSVNPASGTFIIQAKHTSSPIASCSDYDFKTTLIDKEVPKIKRQFDEGRLTHYLLFTNRRKTGGAEVVIPDKIKAATGVQYVWLLGLEDVEREVLLHPQIAKAVGLDKLRSPIIFTPDDFRDVIIAFHSQRQNIASNFDSEHDYRGYPGLQRKNEINGLTEQYDAYIRSDSMPHFQLIEQFLKNPRNEVLKEQYHAVADELKGQLIVHRESYVSFDDALEQTAALVSERSPEIQVAAKRRLIKIMVHYMYVNCEIGRKS